MSEYNTENSMYNCNLRQVTYALSEALDYVGIDDLNHGKRVAYMAAQLANALGFSQTEVDQIITVGMLHDCGVSRTKVHKQLVNELDWGGSQDHCARGAMLLKNVSVYANYAEIIHYHHTHWEVLQRLDIDPQDKINANIIFLVDRVDALRAQGKSHEEISKILAAHSNTMFVPDLVQQFNIISRPDSFWFYLEHDNLELFLHEWINQYVETRCDFNLLKEIALFFSRIVDAKSPFTYEHSINVAKVAVYIAKKMGMNQTQCENIEFASLLHDLGKLKVDDAILEKQGPLNKSERKIMDKHGFDSEMILRKIDGFKEIATLAGFHHEFLDGKGYPYQKSAEDIPIEARIIIVSDIFQALVQNRPYRSKLEPLETLEILEKMIQDGKLDRRVMEIVKNDLSDLYELASSSVV